MDRPATAAAAEVLAGLLAVPATFDGSAWVQWVGPALRQALAAAPLGELTCGRQEASAAPFTAAFCTARYAQRDPLPCFPSHNDACKLAAHACPATLSVSCFTVSFVSLPPLPENLDLWSSCTLRYAGHHLAVAELGGAAQRAQRGDAPSPLQQLLDAVAEPLPEGEPV